MIDAKMKSILEEMVRAGASDTYITVGRPITMRVRDTFMENNDHPAMSVDSIDQMLKFLLSEKQYNDFQAFHEMNVSFGLPGLGRFRINVLQQRQTPSLVIRTIKREIPAFETLGLPESLKEIVLNKRGIILLTGMTGSGKSTTLASMLEYRNQTTDGHILTIEDPIEYLYEHKRSLVTQREVGVDTDNYHLALKNSFRQKADVVLIGEIRDRFVMEQALVAAETGQLCLSTVHANNAYQAIERILNFFEETQLAQARINLALNLRGIIAQRMVPGVYGDMVLAYEIMLNEGYIRDLILKGETSKIREVIAQNTASGMVTFDQTLFQLYLEGKITEETAVAEADMPIDMELTIKKQKIATSFSSAQRL